MIARITVYYPNSGEVREFCFPVKFDQPGMFTDLMTLNRCRVWLKGVNHQDSKTSVCIVDALAEDSKITMCEDLQDFIKKHVISIRLSE